MSASERAAEAGRAMARLDHLATLSDEPGRITRLAFSPALATANATLIGWMRAAGMTAATDAAGNVVGRYEGARDDAPALMLGSHLDTVPNGGRHDGMLGVVAALAVVERLARDRLRLPFAVEIVAFADEEGTRYGGTILGSWAMAGAIPADWRGRVDSAGIRAEDAVRAFGVDPEAVGAASRAMNPPLAYLELHIEQGPALEETGAPLGVVTAIAGATRALVVIEGKAGHAGTVPMHLRRDALVAAAACIGAVHDLARASPAVATVGQIAAEPGAVNVIPGRVTFSLDIRAAADDERFALVEGIRRAFAAVAAAHCVTCAWTVTSETQAVAAAPDLVDAAAATLAEMGLPPLQLPSGAGHDGIAMSRIAPIGMLFLRCAGGISHHPDEAITLDDLGLGIEALHRLTRRLADARA